VWAPTFTICICTTLCYMFGVRCSYKARPRDAWDLCKGKWVWTSITFCGPWIEIWGFHIFTSVRVAIINFFQQSFDGEITNEWRPLTINTPRAISYLGSQSPVFILEAKIIKFQWNNIKILGGGGISTGALGSCPTCFQGRYGYVSTVIIIILLSNDSRGTTYFNIRLQTI